MKSSCFIRKIDELGRVVLPIEMRQYLDIKEKDPLEILLKEDGIFLQKHASACIFCHATTHLKNFSDKLVCMDCMEKIKKN